MKNGIKIENLGKRLASINMRAQIAAQPTSEKTQKVIDTASLWFFGNAPNSVQDAVQVPTQKPILTDDRYVYANFRALSAVYLERRGLDFSTPGVLEASVDLLKNKTVYPNHNFTDIYNWLGSVSNAVWDAEGEQSGGVPGVNCEIKIDAFLNYRIACGVMMTPPAINSMSLTVLFEFEYSHPQLVEEKRFWHLLGEEIDGEIVRLIVTKIVDYWEASLVFLGEDRLAKHHGTKPSEGDDAGDDDGDGVTTSFSAANPALPTNSNEEKTMKIEKAKRTELGIEFDGDDVPETEILKAAETLAAANKQFDGVDLADLQEKAGQAEKLLTAKRAEVTRLARIAELGADEGELDEIVSQQIEVADADKLVKLETYFQKKAAEKFPNRRSSMESSDEVEGAGGVNKQSRSAPAKKIGLH